MPEDNPEQFDPRDSSEVKVRRRRKRNDPSPESRRNMFLGKKKRRPKEIAKKVGLIVLGIFVAVAIVYLFWRLI